MMERREYTNPWADKLQEVELPDANDSWRAMATLLDTEMPIPRQPNRRRWLLLVILLLLLIGVCNCPRQGLWHKEQASGHLPAVPPAGVTPSSNGSQPGVPAQGRTHRVSGPQASGPANSVSPAPSASGASDSGTSANATAGIPSTARTTPASDTRRHDTVASKRIRPTPDDYSAVPKSNLGVPAVRSTTSGFTTSGSKSHGSKTLHGSTTSHGSTTPGSRTSGSPVPGPTTPGSSRRSSPPPSSRSSRFKDDRRGGHTAVGDNPHARAAGEPSDSSAGTVSGRAAGKGKNVPGNIADTAAVSRSITSAGSGKKGKDSVAAATPENKKTPAADTVQKETERGLVAGIGFNQFFSVGQQQKSDYNSGGTSGGLGDYLPVPMVRYYFSRKLYVQLEAQFNTPQYTKKNLVAGQSAGDSLSPGVVQQNSVTIKKLFYFNLPLSVHYSPLKNLYLGAGLQYSRLTNGVGLYQDKVLVTGGSDTVKAVKIYSFKGDSIYQKMRTNELRFLLDINYTYKRIIVGARYNQALSKFLDVHISNTQVTQARNSSLQLYLRYILWDNRKKKKLSSK